MNKQLYREIDNLILKVLENCISDQELSRLDDWFATDPHSMDYYCEFMKNYTALITKFSDEARMVHQMDQEEGVNTKLWQELAEEEKSSPTIEVSYPVQLPESSLIRNVQKDPTVRSINKFSLSLAITTIAALFVMIAYVYLSGPAPYEVATISDSINARWSSDLNIKPGVRLSSNTKPIQLTQGIVNLVTDDGVKIVLEAPAEFNFASYAEVGLNYGKLFAHVSEQGAGFSVSTPNSKVVDLGTEFGVISQIDGNTEVYMYEGRANLFARQNTKSTSMLLTAGSANKVDRINSNILQIPMQEDIVVRHIDSKTNFIWRGQSNISLADIVGGGNGFEGGKLNAGIDVATGKTISDLGTEAVMVGSAGYKAVGSHACIDGVFVPGLEEKMTPITSDGSIAVEFPKTAGNYWGYIFNGAFHQGENVPRHALQLNGVVYGTPENPAISIHSNQGITFDLANIRKTIPGMNITKFRSLVGISETVNSYATDTNAEFWVFLDGNKVYEATLSNTDEPVQLDIPISAKNRFLTLAVTEAGYAWGYDWALFGRPELTIGPTK